MSYHHVTLSWAQTDPQTVNYAADSALAYHAEDSSAL